MEVPLVAKIDRNREGRNLPDGTHVIDTLTAETRERYGAEVRRPEQSTLEKARSTRGRWQYAPS